MKRQPPENTPRVVLLAVGLTASATAAAAFEGVFAKLDPIVLVALAVYAAGFALLTYALDRGVRRTIDNAFATLVPRRRKRATSPAAKSPGASPAAL